MDIKVIGQCSFDDKKAIKHFIGYVSGKFKFPKTTITIKFVDPMTLKGQERKDLRKYMAWMQQHARRKFTITISTSVRSLKDILICIGHELVHAKQYLKGEMVDLPGGLVKFRGKLFEYHEYGEGYWFSPWEIEAYGMELGLYECFVESAK